MIKEKIERTAWGHRGLLKERVKELTAPLAWDFSYLYVTTSPTSLAWELD